MKSLTLTYELFIIKNFPPQPQRHHAGVSQQTEQGGRLKAVIVKHRFKSNGFAWHKECCDSLLLPHEPFG